MNPLIRVKRNPTALRPRNMKTRVTRCSRIVYSPTIGYEAAESPLRIRKVAIRTYFLAFGGHPNQTRTSCENTSLLSWAACSAAPLNPPYSPPCRSAGCNQSAVCEARSALVEAVAREGPTGPASEAFRSVARPHRSYGYASGALGPKTPQPQDLTAPRNGRVANEAGSKLHQRYRS